MKPWSMSKKGNQPCYVEEHALSAAGNVKRQSNFISKIPRLVRTGPTQTHAVKYGEFLVEDKNHLLKMKPARNVAVEMSERPCKLYQEQILKTDKTLNAFGVCPKCLWNIGDHDHAPQETFELSEILRAIKLDQNEQKQKSVSFMQTMLLDMKDLKQQTKISYKSMTPSAACQSENCLEFMELFESLRLAYSPYLSEMVKQYEGPELTKFDKFSFRWGAPTGEAGAGEECDDGGQEGVEDAIKDRILERSAYNPLIQYLTSLEIDCADVSEGARCLNKNLFNSDVYTIRKGTSFSTASLRIIAQAPVFIQNVRGRSDVAALRTEFSKSKIIHKAHVKVTIEVKTVKGMRKVDGALREAAVQLVGLNTQNGEISPVVLLTNLAKTHFVLYLTMGDDPAHHLEYHMHIFQFKSFESGLEFAIMQSEREPISLHFGRKPTPPASVAEDEDGSRGSV